MSYTTAYIIIGLMYAVLIGYSAYHMFFSKEPVFDNKYKIRNLKIFKTLRNGR